MRREESVPRRLPSDFFNLVIAMGDEFPILMEKAEQMRSECRTEGAEFLEKPAISRSISQTTSEQNYMFTTKAQCASIVLDVEGTPTSYGAS